MRILVETGSGLDEWGDSSAAVVASGGIPVKIGKGVASSSAVDAGGETLDASGTLGISVIMESGTGDSPLPAFFFASDSGMGRVCVDTFGWWTAVV